MLSELFNIILAFAIGIAVLGALYLGIFAFFGIVLFFLHLFGIFE